VTDENVVAAGHLETLRRALAAHEGGSLRLLGCIVLSPGEATKCFGELARLAERLLELGVERGDALIALGGGVIGDLTGFAAAILRRGVRFAQMPTTLLAHVDSSVGGKTGINTPQGKNLIGAFHQPSLVLADIATLTTLPDRQLRAGYAEIVKHALLGDAAYFDWLETNASAVLARDPSALAHAIARSVEMKAAIVARDETEQGDRMLLNLGHTFGHALEAWAGFSDRLLHGEAVALGTAQAFRFSERRGLVPTGTAARVVAHLKTADLPTRIADIGGQRRPTRAELMRLMAQDKKVRAGRMTFILARGIGEAFVTRDVEPAEIEQFLDDETVG
jgi:3-dehydroquinate synthase